MVTSDESNIAQPEPEADPQADPRADPQADSTALPDRVPEPTVPRTARETSGPAIAATAALVLFSVFIGVFGPRIGNRQQSPSGVTLIELAEAVVARSQPHIVDARVARKDAMTEQEFDLRLDEITGSGVALPSLEALNLEPTSVQRVRLPGASGGFAVLRGRRGGAEALVTVALLEDEDRFTVYDRYGRPIPLPEGEVFSVEDRMSSPPGTVEVYLDGGYVYAVYAKSLELARETVAALQTAAAKRASAQATTPK